MELRDAYEQALNYEQKEDDEEAGDAITLWVKNWRNYIPIIPEDFYMKNGKNFLRGVCYYHAGASFRV